MKLQQTPNFSLEQNYKQNNSKTSFNGVGLDAAMNFLQTNQAMGATAVDITCMGLPRTAVELTRSPQAAVEAARREFSSTFNDALLGVYGIGSAALLAKGLNKEYGLTNKGFKANNLSIDNNMLDILADIRTKSGNIKDGSNFDKYLTEVLDNTKVFSPNAKHAKDGMVSISKDLQQQIKNEIKLELLNESSNKKSFEQTAGRIKSMLINDTGSETGYILSKKVAETAKKSDSAVSDYVDNIMRVSKTFMSDKVSAAFDSAKSVDSNAFIKAIKKLNTKATAMGIGLCALVGASVQPINIYLTKKKTGQSGFVGGGEEDKSLKFKALKTTVATAGMLGALASISPNFKKIPEALKFKGALPTIPQFKFVYGLTIFSRLLSARNGNELREGTIKDSLGFVNWLILGSFVQKFAAMGFEKASKGSEKYLKRPTDAKNAVSKFFGSEVISRSEVLQEAFKKLGKSPVENGKAMSFKQMHKVVSDAVKNGQLDKTFKGKLKALNLIQLAGYAYSGLVLGICIPKLNIAITKHFQKKEEEKQQKAV